MATPTSRRRSRRRLARSSRRGAATPSPAARRRGTARPSGRASRRPPRRPASRTARRTRRRTRTRSSGRFRWRRRGASREASSRFGRPPRGQTNASGLVDRVGHDSPMAEERRLVTVLFADVVGSTALGEALDPEDVRALLAPPVRDRDRCRGAPRRPRREVHRRRDHGRLRRPDRPRRRRGSGAVRGDGAARPRPRRSRARAAASRIRLGVNGGEVIASREEDARVLVTGDP